MDDREPVGSGPVEAGAAPSAAPSAAPLAAPDAAARPIAGAGAAPPSRPTLRFLFRHPAHFIALGAGTGLFPWAPGTVGTLWAWLVFWDLDRRVTEPGWALLIAFGLVVGWWACTVTARHLAVQDPSCIVWDEIIAFWIVLWLVMPAGFVEQLAAFALFRFFDAAKPGPVGWADRAFKARPGAAGARIGAAQGFGIVFDDLVAAGCTLLVFALWRFAVG
jgi:phosphatidylglycerophosphatase A